MRALYVPLERMDLVQNYRVLEGTHPPLDKLGGNRLELAQDPPPRKSVEDMADQLLALYAQRKTTEGFAFSPDGNFQREFEGCLRIRGNHRPGSRPSANIKRDMETRPSPWTACFCGDVGYGKDRSRHGGRGLQKP